MGGGKGGPDLSDAQLNAPMRNAAFISGCGAPDSMKVTVKVAVKMGRAVGVSVYTNPPNAGVASCIDRAVRGLGQFERGQRTLQGRPGSGVDQERVGHGMGADRRW